MARGTPKLAGVFVLVLAGPAWHSPAWAGPGAGGPGEKPPEAPAARLAPDEAAVIRDECIRTIRTHKDPDAIVLAYRRGCSVDCDSAQLHRSYMERMLKMGLVHVAYAPAAALGQLDPANVTAFATVGYVQARRGRMADALSATVKAAKLAPKDPSILNNLGQLAAWLEADVGGLKVDEPTRAAMEEMKVALHRERSFRQAYQLGKGILAERDEIERRYRNQVSRAEAAVDNAQEQRDKPKVSGHLDRRVAAGEDLARKRAELLALQQEKQKALEELDRKWQWDPPTVGGVIATVVTSVPGSRLIPEEGSEEAAAGKLKTAELFLSNGFHEKAEALLREIVDKHVGTESAARAEQLLAGLRAKKGT